MTSVELMTPRELLELATLDTFGLLDPVEEDLYTRSFHDAPATVQDEIVRLQAQIAEDLSLLPGDEPDPSLRERVLKAVAEAIERDDTKLAPLAHIGPRRPDERGGDGRYAGAAAAQFWRAASFVLAGVSLIMVYFLAIGSQRSDELTKAALYDDAKKLEVLLKSRPKEFLVDDLPPTDGAEYVLQVKLEDGGTEKVQAFASLGGFGGVRIDNVSVDLIAAVGRWQIAELATGVVLLSAT
ncbi:MAG: hypothetical protein ACYSU2_00185 [Planctomycetota bacterium]|jgi:hypothetical protein